MIGAKDNKGKILKPPGLEPNLTVAYLRQGKLLSVPLHKIQTVAQKNEMKRIEPGPMSSRYIKDKKPQIPLCLESFFEVQRNCAKLLDEKARVKLEKEYANTYINQHRIQSKGRAILVFINRLCIHCL